MDPPSTTGPVRETRWDRGDAIALAALAACTALAAVLLIRAPSVVGATQDDGVYLCTAKALADGRGYRLIHLPGEPWQTKYPILYPLLLAAIWRCWPQFPDNAAAIQIVNAALWGIGSWIAYRLMRRCWDLPWWLAGGCAGLGVVSYATLSLLQTAMSEALYFPLSLAALAAAVKGAGNGERGAGNGERGSGNGERGSGNGDRVAGTGRPGWALAAGALAGAAYLTRSIGIAVVVAVVGHFLLRRRWRSALAAALVSGLAVGGWAAWRVHAARLNAEIATTGALRYDLDYSAWLPPTLGKAVWVMFNNAAEATLALARILTPPPHDWLTVPIAGGTPRGLFVYALLLAVLVLTATGFVATWRRGRGVAHVASAAYGLAVLAWPYEPFRFLIPLLPFLVLWPIAGLGTLAGAVGGFLSGGSEPRRRPTWPSAAALGLLVFVNGRFVLVQPGREYLLERQRSREALAAFVRDFTPQDSVVYTTFGGYLHLVTGRATPPWLLTFESISHLYPADRIVLECGSGERTPEGAAADARIVREHWIENLRAVGATHVVAPPEWKTFGEAFRALRADRPQLFQRIGEAGGYEVLRFRSDSPGFG